MAKPKIRSDGRTITVRVPISIRKRGGRKVVLTPDGVAHICSYECTYCANCTEQINAICPNCGGELVRRPRRQERFGSSAAGV